MKTVDLSNPNDCRWCCENFRLPDGRQPTFVDLADGSRIFLNNMNDQQALFVANQFHAMHIQGTMMAKNELVKQGYQLQ